MSNKRLFHVSKDHEIYFFGLPGPQNIYFDIKIICLGQLWTKIWPKVYFSNMIWRPFWISSIKNFPQGSRPCSRWFCDQEVQLNQKPPKNICYVTKHGSMDNMIQIVLKYTQIRYCHNSKKLKHAHWPVTKSQTRAVEGCSLMYALLSPAHWTQLLPMLQLE